MTVFKIRPPEEPKRKKRSRMHSNPRLKAFSESPYQGEKSGSIPFQNESLGAILPNQPVKQKLEGR